MKYIIKYKIFISLTSILLLLIVINYKIKFENLLLYLNDYKYENKFTHIISSRSTNNDTLILLTKKKFDDQFILDYIKRDTSFNSQRLIIGLNAQYSIRYLMFRFTPLKNTIKYSQKINTDNILKLNTIYKYGIGGLDIRPNILIQFNSFRSLNQFLDSLRIKLAKKITFTNGSIKKSIKIYPVFYIDWDFYNSGLNYKIFSTYTDFDKKSGYLNILKLNIDGIFGPQVDYTNNLEYSTSIINNSIKILEKNNKICFLKHFGYRKDYRFSKFSKNNDTHIDKVLVMTPVPKFFNQDYKVLKNFYESNNSVGLMLGHHILYNIDSNNIVSTSIKIDSLIKSNFHNSLTISDDIGMASYSKYNENSNYYENIITNLVLISNYRNFKFVSLNNISVSNSEKILNYKLNKSFLKIF